MNETNEVFIELTLDFKGSDGMSDKTFAYSAQIGTYYGGCE
jgi:uncharacterized membrane protein